METASNRCFWWRHSFSNLELFSLMLLLRIFSRSLFFPAYQWIFSHNFLNSVIQCLMEAAKNSIKFSTIKLRWLKVKSIFLLKIHFQIRFTRVYLPWLIWEIPNNLIIKLPFQHDLLFYNSESSSMSNKLDVLSSEVSFSSFWRFFSFLLRNFENNLFVWFSEHANTGDCLFPWSIVTTLHVTATRHILSFACNNMFVFLTIDRS